MARLVHLHDASDEEVIVNPAHVRELRRDLPGMVSVKFDERHSIIVKGQLEVVATEIEKAIKDE